MADDVLTFLPPGRPDPERVYVRFTDGCEVAFGRAVTLEAALAFHDAIEHRLPAGSVSIASDATPASVTRPPDELTPEQAERARTERTGSWPDPNWGPFHRHFANDAIHRDGGPECDQPGTPRRVYVFDPDYLDAHEAHITERVRAEEQQRIAAAIRAEVESERGGPALAWYRAGPRAGRLISALTGEPMTTGEERHYIDGTHRGMLRAAVIAGGPPAPITQEEQDMSYPNGLKIDPRRHQSTLHFAPLFGYAHLPDGKTRTISAESQLLAQQMVDALPDGPELTAGLRKLLEAKDCFVRAALTS